MFGAGHPQLFFPITLVKMVTCLFPTLLSASKEYYALNDNDSNDNDANNVDVHCRER